MGDEIDGFEEDMEFDLGWDCDWMDWRNSREGVGSQAARAGESRGEKGMSRYQPSSENRL